LLHQRLHLRHEKRRKSGSDVTSGRPAEQTETKPVEDFAAALMMLAQLPLSEQERADAVRRLLLKR